MLNNFKIITLTHKSFPLQDLGAFILEENNLQNRLTDIKNHFNFRGLFYTATCNRLLFLIDDTTEETDTFVQDFFLTVYEGLPSKQLQNAISKVEYYKQDQAIRHIYEVSSSVDSLVVGEREIFRQLREAYEKCYHWNLISDQIRIAFQSMVKVAKQVYATTRIGEKSVSVVSLAISKLLALHIPKDEKIVLIGAGQTNLLVCKFLKKNGFDNISVYNRTFTKAQLLANKFKYGTAHQLNELTTLDDFKVIFLTTSSKNHILTEEHIKNLRLRKDRRFIVDLSIPANVDPEFCLSEGIDLIDIEALKNLAKENLSFRIKEVEKVNHIIEQSVKEFRGLFHQRLIEKAFSNIPDEIKAIKKRATEQVFHNELNLLDDESKALVTKMMDYMEKKCIGIPMKAAKSVII